MPSAADYAWFTQDNELVNGFSLSWAQDITPAEVVSRLDGTVVRHSDWDHLYEDLQPERSGGPYVLAIAQAAGWSMALDPAGMFGIEEGPLRGLSHGTTVIYQFLNVELDDQYRLVKDGTVHVDFQPSAPDHRLGSNPDELLDAMARVGFEVKPRSSAASSPVEQPDPTQTAFALTEYLTGIRLSMTLLESQSYLMVSVPDR